MDGVAVNSVVSKFLEAHGTVCSYVIAGVWQRMHVFAEPGGRSMRWA